MNVHRSGLEISGDDIDRHFELSGSDYDLNLTKADVQKHNQRQEIQA